MSRRIASWLVVAVLGFAGVASAQTPSSPDSAKIAATSPPPAPKEPSKIYYGGAVGLSFWNDYTRISVEPLVGYKLTPQASLGGRVRYEYFNDKRGSSDYDSHNYGLSVFSRYRLRPELFAHAEFAYMSFDYVSGREAVPFLFLGGGFSKPMGKNAWAYAEVLVDVLQDGNSPYEDWEPRVSVGVGVGF